MILLLDMSDSMRRGGRVETGKQAVSTILKTLTPQDSVTVQMIGGSTPGLPPFARKGLIPATDFNIARLRQWLERAAVMGQQEVSQALAEGLGVLGVRRVDSGTQTAEPQGASIKNFMFLVSDGELLASDLALAADASRLDSIHASIREDLLPRTHVMTVAVGQGAKQDDLRTISCKLNGLFFIVAEDQGPSAMRTSLSKWYQMVAAPLAPLQADGSLLPTWSKPFLSSSRQEIHITVGLPVFVDLTLDMPQLVGAVSFDVAVAAPSTPSAALRPLPCLNPKP